VPWITIETTFQQQPHHADGNAISHQRNSEATSQMRMMPTNPKADQQGRKQLKQEPQKTRRKNTSKT
jgi:hypothetical protein